MAIFFINMHLNPLWKLECHEWAHGLSQVWVPPTAQLHWAWCNADVEPLVVAGFSAVIFPSQQRSSWDRWMGINITAYQDATRFKMASNSDNFDTSFKDDFPSLHLDQDSSDGNGNISPSDPDDGASDYDLTLAKLTSNAATSWHGATFRAVHRLDFVGLRDAATAEIDFLQLFLPDDVLLDVDDETNR